MPFAIRYRGAAAALLAALLGACSTVPSTNIRPPLSVRPQAHSVSAENNGAIYQPRQGMVLFEDRRARQIGDTLTVRLLDKDSIGRRNETTDSRAASGELNVPTPQILGRSPNIIGATSWNASGDLSHSFKDNDTNSNTVAGSITVTVIDVLENGNLVVAGEKQVSINSDTDYIRLAGIASPRDITASNTINSTQLADVQIESKNSQSIDNAQLMSMLARFFLTLVPF